MIYTCFSVSENRLNELKSFIRKELPSARFKDNPLKVGDKWIIALNMEIEDSNKLKLLHNKWYEEDNPPKKFLLETFRYAVLEACFDIVVLALSSMPLLFIIYFLFG